MESPLLRLSFHVAVFAIYFSSEYYNLKFVVIDGVVNTYGGRLKFLTFIDTIIQTVYFGFSVVNDLFGSNARPPIPPNKRGKLQKIRDLLAASIVFPIGAFVVITFWGLYAVDRELVFPKKLDAIVARWLNHVMHSTVLLFLLLEKYFVYHHYPSRKTGLMCIVGFALLYQSWVLWIAYHADIWVYPVLQVLNWPGRFGFFATCWVFLIGLYLIGEKITKKVWSTSSPSPVRTRQD